MNDQCTTCLTEALGRVRKFNEQAGVKTRRVGELKDVPSKEQSLRLKLLQEELSELEDALIFDNEVEVADALADILFVLLGTALAFGCPLGEVFEEVCRSNMTKFAQGAHFREDGKLMKGPAFEPPDVAGVLERCKGMGL